MKDIKAIFKYKSADEKKLLEYGFKKTGKKGVLEFRKRLPESGFEMLVRYDGHEVSPEVIDPFDDGAYTLFLQETATGKFLGKINEEFFSTIEDIAEKCFHMSPFKERASQKVIEFAQKTYSSRLEFLWDDLPNVAVLRRNDTDKWFGIIFSLPKRRLGIDSDETVEFMNLRGDPDQIQSIIDSQKFFPAYHMNKKHWYTLLLDGSVKLAEIKTRIKESYALALKNHAAKKRLNRAKAE